MKRNYLFFFLSSVFSLILFSCGDSPDDGPDFNVHTVDIDYSGNTIFYNNSSNSIYIYGGSGGNFSCHNCTPVSYGNIIEATATIIEIDPSTGIQQTVPSIPTFNMDPSKGYIMKGNWITSSSYGQAKTNEIYFYLYFTEYQETAAAGYYRPHKAHYQRFK